jgi:hypothetical protein
VPGLRAHNDPRAHARAYVAVRGVRGEEMFTVNTTIEYRCSQITVKGPHRVSLTNPSSYIWTSIRIKNHKSLGFCVQVWDEDDEYEVSAHAGRSLTMAKRVVDKRLGKIGWLWRMRFMRRWLFD